MHLSHVSFLLRFKKVRFLSVVGTKLSTGDLPACMDKAMQACMDKATKLS